MVSGSREGPAHADPISAKLELLPVLTLIVMKFSQLDLQAHCVHRTGVLNNKGEPFGSPLPPDSLSSLADHSLLLASCDEHRACRVDAYGHHRLSRTILRKLVLIGGGLKIVG